MSNNSKNICRLCLGIDDIFEEEIEDIYKEILDVLRIKIDWSLTETPALCENCCRKLHESFTFKANCIDIEDYLTPMRDNGKLDLRKVCALPKHSKALDLICRLCVEWIEQEVTLTEIEKERFKLYLPEIDLKSTSNPVICSVCYDSFRSFLSFTERCIQNEQKFVEYSKKTKMIIKSPIFLNKFSEYLESPDSSTRLCRHLNSKVKSEKLDEYKCDICSHTSESVTDIDAHKVSHVNSSDIELLNCPTMVCRGQQTRHKSVLRKHITTVHSDKKYFCCSFATKLKVSLEKHIDSHNASILECKSCHFKTKCAASLNNHACRVKQVEKELKCIKCSYKAISKSSLTRHSTRHKPLSELKICKCNFCEYKSIPKRTVAKHMLLHQKSKKTMYKCNHCQFETYRKRCLSKHLQQHDSKWARSLIGHKKILHKPSEVNMFKCEVCPFESKWAGSLINHKKIHRKPSEMNIFKCKECPFESIWSKNLTRHKKIHCKPSEVNMFKCDQCPYESKWAHNLSDHKKIHHKPSEVNIFKCEECPFETKWSTNIIRHEKIHRKSSEVNMFKCDECPFGSKWAGSLFNHKKIHRKLSEMNLFKCEECPFESKWTRSLIRHRKIHRKP